MPVTFRIEHFEGPLDLLLQLVEKEQLDISTVSLATVAEQFVMYVNEAKDIPPEELADFLVVAAKLMYLKSKLLLPSLHEAEMEEGPDLETQLREYQRFVAASKKIEALWRTDQRSFMRQAVPVMAPEAGFSPPSGITVEILRGIMRRVIGRIEPLARLPQVSIERAVTIQEKIRDLFQRVRQHAQITFSSFVSSTAHRTDAIVSFLALLELVKQRFVNVDQGEIFHDIIIRHHPDAPATDPFVDYSL